MEQVYDLPIMVLGEKIEITADTEFETVKYERGITVRIPKTTKEHVEKIKSSNNDELKKLSLEQITVFLSKVGQLWVNPDYELRKKAIELSSKLTGFDECFIGRDFDLMGDYIRLRPEVYDQVDTELGNYLLLDEWILKHESYIHAEPRGKVLHIMVGNIPIASMYSVIRGILTKNMNIAKLPTRDLATCLYFLLSFIEVDPNHPITRSLSALYWKRGNIEIEDKMISQSDVVCVWGGEGVVKAIKPKVPHGVEFIEFGPKRSLSIIDLNLVDANDLDRTACRLAGDMSVYNQEACFSAQLAFIMGNKVDEFIESLKGWLDKTIKRWPAGFLTFDNYAHLSINKLKETFSGHQVISAEGNKWCIIKCKDIDYLPEHPLGRTIYLYCIDDISQMYHFINRDVQTIGVYPWSVAFNHKDDLAERGVERICELGLHAIPRIGWAHDSMFPMSRMVRFISLELSLAKKGKYYEGDAAHDFMCFGYYTSEDEVRRLVKDNMLPPSFIPKHIVEG